MDFKGAEEMTGHISKGILYMDGVQCRPVEKLTRLEAQREWMAWIGYMAGMDIPIIRARCTMLETRVMSFKPEIKEEVW